MSDTQKISGFITGVAIVIVGFIWSLGYNTLAQISYNSRYRVDYISYNSIYGLLAMSTPTEVEIYNSDLALLETLPRTSTNGFTTAIAWRPDGLQIAIDNEPNVVIWNYDPINKTFHEFTTISPSHHNHDFIQAIDWGQQLSVTYTYQPRGLNVSIGEIVMIETVNWTVATVIDDMRLFMIAPYSSLSPSGSEILSSYYYCPDPNIVRECDFPHAFIANTMNGEIVWEREDLETIVATSWSPDGTRFAISGTDISIFDSVSKDLLYTWTDEFGYTGYIDWSADSQSLLSVNGIGEARILDIQSMTVTHEFQTTILPEAPLQIVWDSTTGFIFIETDAERLTSILIDPIE